jgi:hypothetical protein
MLHHYLDAWLIQVPNVGCSLSWLDPNHKHLWVNQTERINDYFSFDRLNGINDNSNGSVIQ